MLKSFALLAALALVSAPISADAESAAKESTTQENTVWRIVGEFEARGIRYLYVLVPKPQDDDALIALAEDIHQSEPDAWLWLGDSDEHIAAAVAANQSGDMSQLPQEWLTQHTVGNSVLMLNPDRSRTWVLNAGSTRDNPVATLPCIDGKGLCKPAAKP